MSRAEPRLSGVAVITGASSGIGESLARKLTSRGWHCVLLARRRERLTPLADELGCEFEVCDVSDPDAVADAARAVTERHPAVHLLVNNAGIAGRSSFFDGEPSTIESVMRTNYLGSVWCLREFRAALEAGAPSHVVNVVSVAGAFALPTAGPYAASKHAQIALSRATAPELRPHGIRVHTVNPGFAATEGFPQTHLMRTPFRRLVIGPDTVAGAIVRAVERDQTEIYVPRWYRPAAVAQALFPGLVTSLLAGRAGARRR